MDENSAWKCFKHTGTVQDYLIYSQCRQMEETKPQEDRDEDRCRGTGNPGEMRG